MTDLAYEIYQDLGEAEEERDLIDDVARLTAEVERLSALLAIQSAPRAKVARKVPAVQWPGRRAMVDDELAGFVALDFLAAGRAGWSAPTHAAPLDPWFAGPAIPADDAARRAAGWQPVTFGLQGGRLEHDRPQWPGDGEQTVRVAGWVESPEYHQAVCRPHEVAILAERAERKAAAA